MLESQGTGREVHSSDRVGIYDRKSKVEGKDFWRTFLEGVWFCRGRPGRPGWGTRARKKYGRYRICDERFCSYWFPGLVELIFLDGFDREWVVRGKSFGNAFDYMEANPPAVRAARRGNGIHKRSSKSSVKISMRNLVDQGVLAKRAGTLSQSD